jgi:SAM-dependent methyltransferase
MNWRLKVAAYKLLAAMPGGSAFYRFSQQQITKSITPTPERVGQKIEVAMRYFDWLEKHNKLSQLLKGVHLDFGSGWHPTIPFLYYSMGVERQYLFDISPVMDGQMVVETLRVFLAMVAEKNWPHRARLCRLPPQMAGGDWQKYLDGIGITYHAPYSDIFPSLAGKVDVVTSTQVLLHIPPSVMPDCFRQIHNCLKPGGLFLATVHLRDILAGCFQTGLQKYRQLRYSPETWEKWINSPLMSFNRLKAPDYRSFLENAGFGIRHFEIEAGTATEINELDQVPIDPWFQKYSREELAARHLFFAVQKQ